MKTIRFSVFAVFTILAFSLFTNAQLPVPSPTVAAVVPRLVNFSGVALNAQGKPLSGTAGVTFSIYKDQSAGAPLWMETQNVQVDGKGNYSIQLGATKSVGLPLELFASGEARWLGVRVNGGEEQPRVMLLSVPYALKAGDAATIGGLPPSAFVLAATPGSGASGSGEGAAPSNPSAGATPSASNVTTTGGTVSTIPLWTTGTNVQSSAITQTGSGAASKVGINIANPAATLDVKGTATFRGNLGLAATGNAVAAGGKNSQPQTFTASSFNGFTAAPTNQNLRWQAEPAGNNSAAPSATLNFLYGVGSAAPSETGLKIGSNGQITFAAGQTFPGAVQSIGLSAPSSDFTVSGSPVNGTGTLGLAWNVAPDTADTANAIVKRDGNGGFSAGAISAGGLTSLSSGIAVYGETSGSGGGADGVHGVAHGAGSGVTGLSDNAGGVGVWAQGPGYALYANGNTGQGRSYGGMVKAMVKVGEGNTIFGCFNSTLAGPAATTPPCGFATSFDSQLGVTVDFGFEVDDRFYSSTLARCSCGTNIPVLFATPTGTTTVRVGVYVGGSGTSSQIPSIWHLIVY
jgi:hypothetical protein